MRILQIGVGLTLALFFNCFAATAQEQKMTVVGKLGRVMAIGGESAGWAIELERETSVGGKQVHSVEVDASDKTKLEKLDNKRVRAVGKLSSRHAVERGDRVVLEISSIREVKGKAQAPQPAMTTYSLTGSEWLLEDLAGSGVIDNVQATIAFQEAGRVSGRGSCNRFFGPAEIHGDAIKLGPLGGTRMACPEAVMNQEAQYMKALEAAERFEVKDSTLLLHCKGFNQPLRFTRKEAAH